MIKSDTVKGYLYALGATLAMSNVYIFSKAALQEISLATFWFYWFLFGLVWFAIYLVVRGELKNLLRLTKKQYIQLSTIGLLEIGGTASFFIAIHTVENPSIVSFLGNISPVFVAILSFSLLGERFSKQELLGMLITLIGVFTISYKPGSTLESLFIPGVGFVLFSSAMGAVVTIVIKKGVAKIQPVFISFSRTFYLFLASTIYLATQNFPLNISTTAFWNTLAGSFLGPFMAVSFSYFALKYIKASQSSILGSTKSFFVLVGAYIYFGHWPFSYQIIGGSIAVLGVITIILAKQKKQVPK